MGRCYWIFFWWIIAWNECSWNERYYFWTSRCSQAINWDLTPIKFTRLIIFNGHNEAERICLKLGMTEAIVAMNSAKRRHRPLRNCNEIVLSKKRVAARQLKNPWVNLSDMILIIKLESLNIWLGCQIRENGLRLLHTDLDLLRPCVCYHPVAMQTNIYWYIIPHLRRTKLTVL